MKVLENNMTRSEIKSKPLQSKLKHYVSYMLGIAGLALLGGCGTGHSFTHDVDPLLGSFNRPITPTPPPTGPDIGNVYQGGPGVYGPPAIGAGMTAPVPGAMGGAMVPSGVLNMPQNVSSNSGIANWKNIFNAPSPREALNRATVQNNSSVNSGTPQRMGAGIPLNNRFEQPAPPPQTPGWMAPQKSGEVVFNSPTNFSPVSGASRVGSTVPTISQQTGLIRTTTQIQSAKEGITLITTRGGQDCKLVPGNNGDWVFSCRIQDPVQGVKTVSAQSPSQLEAVRTVLARVQEMQ